VKLDNNPSGLRLGYKKIEKLLSIESRWQSWLDIEASLAIAQSKLGMIPKKIGKKIAEKCKLSKLNQKNIIKGLKKTGHKLVPLIWELSRICDKEAKKFVHWGATTQNITQTGDVIILKKIHTIFLNDIADILKILSKIALKSKDYVMAGRTHGQHALPITFGFKVACWIDEIGRHIDRLVESEPRIFRCLFGGAVGTAASFGKYGLRIEKEIAKNLKLYPTKIPSRNHLDNFAEYTLIIIMISTTFGKISEEIFNLMRNETSEVEEPINFDDVGSSTMPQKRNPHLTQDVIAYAAQSRSLSTLVFSSMLTQNEGSRQHSLMSISALHDSCIKLEQILSTSKYILKNLKINKKRMLTNLNISQGSIVSEAIMLKLGKIIGRQKAHEIIHDCYNYSFTEKINFIEIVKSNSIIKKYLSKKEIDEMIDPNNYTGLSSKFATEQSTNALNIYKKIKKKLKLI
jgi:3-carboxy-cis,cis-muconate cycloisomerase